MSLSLSLDLSISSLSIYHSFYLSIYLSNYLSLSLDLPSDSSPAEFSLTQRSRDSIPEVPGGKNKASLLHLSLLSYYSISTCLSSTDLSLLDRPLNYLSIYRFSIYLSITVLSTYPSPFIDLSLALQSKPPALIQPPPLPTMQSHLLTFLQQSSQLHFSPPNSSLSSPLKLPHNTLLHHTQLSITSPPLHNIHSSFLSLTIITLF